MEQDQVTRPVIWHRSVKVIKKILHSALCYGRHFFQSFSLFSFRNVLLRVHFVSFHNYMYKHFLYRSVKIHLYVSQQLQLYLNPIIQSPLLITCYVTAFGKVYLLISLSVWDLFPENLSAPDWQTWQGVCLNVYRIPVHPDADRNMLSGTKPRKEARISFSHCQNNNFINTLIGCSYEKMISHVPIKVACRHLMDGCELKISLGLWLEIRSFAILPYKLLYDK